MAVSHACVFHFLCSDPVAFDVGTVIAFLSDAVHVCCLSPNLYETDSLIARRFAEEGEVGRTAIFRLDCSLSFCAHPPAPLFEVWGG